MEGGFAECDIKIDGKPFLNGSCNFHFFYDNSEATIMYIDSTDYYMQSDIILPNKRVELTFSDIDKKNVEFIIYLEKSMSRYGDAYTSGAPVPFENGCINAGRINACIRYTGGGSETASEEAFRQVPAKMRKKVQEYLAFRNYYTDKVDGAWGKNTSNALRKYDEINGLLNDVFKGKHSHYNLSLFSQNIQLINDAWQEPSTDSFIYFESIRQVDNGYFDLLEFCFNPNGVRAKINEFEGDERSLLTARHVEYHQRWCIERGADDIDAEKYYWSSDKNQCDISLIDVGWDGRADVITANSKVLEKWTKFKIDYYEASCRVDVNYVEPNGSFISGVATCYAEGEESIIDVRVDKQGNDALRIDFRNQYDDFTVYNCN
jgi:hypothetical protein